MLGIKPTLLVLIILILFSDSNMKDQNLEDLINFYICRALVRQGSLGHNITKNVFIRASKDYFREKISAEQLGGIATLLYYEKNKPIETHDWSDNLGGLLDEVSEINYYKNNNDLKTVRNIEKKIRTYLSHTKK